MKNIYSTNETKTNDVWIDGRPIYRKTIPIGVLPNDNSQTFTHGISNLGNVCSIVATWYDTLDNRWFANFRKDSDTIFIAFQVDNINLKVEAKGVNWSARTNNANCTITYTKTTD